MKVFNSEITPYKTYLNRRNFIKGSISTSIASTISMKVNAFHQSSNNIYSSQLDKNDKLNSFEEITTYNNFYEFGMGKSDPSNYSNNFKTKPWSIRIEGLVENKGVFDLEDLLKDITIEDRIYRLRCVEAWSMVIPWQGFELNKIIKRVKPLSNAKYIEFETVYRPEEMPGQKKKVMGFYISWPYI